MKLTIGQKVRFNNTCPKVWQNRYGYVTNIENDRRVRLDTYEASGEFFRNGKIDIQRLAIIKKNSEEDTIQ